MAKTGEVTKEAPGTARQKPWLCEKGFQAQL